MISIDIRHNPEAPVLPMIKALGKARENGAGGEETRLLEALGIVLSEVPDTRSHDAREGDRKVSLESGSLSESSCCPSPAAGSRLWPRSGGR